MSITRVVDVGASRARSRAGRFPKRFRTRNRKGRSTLGTYALTVAAPHRSIVEARPLFKLVAVVFAAIVASTVVVGIATDLTAMVVFAGFLTVFGATAGVFVGLYLQLNRR